MKKIAHLALAGGVAALVLLAAAPMQSSAPVTKPAAPASTSSSAPTWSVDPVHSRGLFRVQHAGAGMFWGGFENVTGTIICDNGKPEGASFEVSIKVDSIDTGVEKLNNHLKSPDFFNAESHPTLTFKSTSVKKGSRDKFLDVTGDLTMNGVTKPVTASVEWTGTSSMMGPRTGYEATINVKRSDWKISYGLDKLAVADDVRLIVSLEATGK